MPLPSGDRPAPPGWPPPTSGILHHMAFELQYREDRSLGRLRKSIVNVLRYDPYTAPEEVADLLSTYDEEGWNDALHEAEDHFLLYAPVGFLAIRATLHQELGVQAFREAVAMTGSWASYYGLRDHARALQRLFNQLGTLRPPRRST